MDNIILAQLSCPWITPCFAYFSGLYYKLITIINDDSSVINKLETSLIDDARVVIYIHHMFIAQATGVCNLIMCINISLHFHVIFFTFKFILQADISDVIFYHQMFEFSPFLGFTLYLSLYLGLLCLSYFAFQAIPFFLCLGLTCITKTNPPKSACFVTAD
jgi:hypothetical protein